MTARSFTKWPNAISEAARATKVNNFFICFNNYLILVSEVKFGVKKEVISLWLRELCATRRTKVSHVTKSIVHFNSHERSEFFRYAQGTSTTFTTTFTPEI